jgi:hypothetical protein
MGATNAALGVVFLGTNELRLFGPPAADRAGALAFEGYYKPGAFWKYDNETGAGLASADTDECPLPVWAHEAVYRCARAKAAARDERAEVRANVPLYRQEYEGRGGELGNVEASAALHHRALRR